MCLQARSTSRSVNRNRPKLRQFCHPAAITSRRGRPEQEVTGVRQDAFANANRTPVEEDKPQGERGRYLHPELFDSDKSVHDVLLHKERVPAPAP